MFGLCCAEPRASAGELLDAGKPGLAPAVDAVGGERAAAANYESIAATNENAKHCKTLQYISTTPP